MISPAVLRSEPAPGRACGACTLCCKVYDVPSLAKPAGRWCGHCKPGRGCGIHDARPDHCRAFHCLWMMADWLGPEWKPDRARMVLTIDPATRALLVQVDPGHPAAWRAEPYRSQLRRWAAAGAADARRVVVFVNKRATLVLPDREIEVGLIEPGDRIVLREHGDGPAVEVVRAAA